MEDKYNSAFLLLKTARFFETKDGNMDINNDVIANYRIEIGIKDRAEKYTILMDQQGGIKLLEGAEISGRVRGNEELEKNKDELESVTIFKHGKPHRTYQTYEEFCWDMEF